MSSASPSGQRPELSETVDRLERIVSVTKELNSTLDLSELARIILRIVRVEVGFDRGTVWVRSPDPQSLRSLVAQDVDEEIRIPVGSGIAGSVANTGTLIDIPDAYRDDRFDASFDAKLGFRTRDIYCMPVRNPHGEVIGVLQLLNRSHELSSEDCGFLSDISVHIGIAIENASRHMAALEEQRLEQQLALAREIILIKSTRKERLLAGVARQKCPVCLGGSIFSGLVGTETRCEDCGYTFRRKSVPLWGAAIFGWAATMLVSFAAAAALTSLVTLPASPVLLSILGAVGLVFMIAFFRYWKAAWIAVDLYSNPPQDEDFDQSKGFLHEVAAAQEAVSEKDRS